MFDARFIALDPTEELKKFTKIQLKEFSFENGLKKYSAGKKEEVIQKIYQNLGQDTEKISRFSNSPKDYKGIFTKMSVFYQKPLSKTDLLFTKRLKEEIYETMQDNCFDSTKLVPFGFFKLFNSKDLSGWSKERKGRLKRGDRCKDIWIKKTFKEDEGVFPKELGGFRKRKYQKYSVKHYDKVIGKYVYVNPRKWRFKLLGVEIRYNISRQYLIYRTKFDRKSWHKTLNKWLIRC